MPAILRLYEDTLSADATLDAALPPMPRMIFVVHGTATIAGKPHHDGEAWFGEGAHTLRPGQTGATCWRFELASSRGADGALRGSHVVSHEKLAVPLDVLPAGDLLMRGDSVAFPPGGCAFLHTHQGPGIRCLVEGGIRIDTHGRSTAYGPGGAWFESGPEPVFAQGADRPTRFIRVMILPRALIGRIITRMKRVGRSCSSTRSTSMRRSRRRRDRGPPPGREPFASRRIKAGPWRGARWQNLRSPSGP